MFPHLHERGSDCIAEFEAAAVRRHREARDLLRRSRDLGAVYLYGYTVELRLKAAYFSTSGVLTQSGLPFGPGDPITRADRDGVAKSGATLGVSLPYGNGHNVAFWAALLVARRAVSLRPYTQAFGQLVSDKAREVYSEWRETIRYRATQPSPRELRYVRDRAEWFGRFYSLVKD